jgi:hypothetical protein
MKAIDLLKRDALLRRNARILAAKRDYYKELKAIKTLGRSLGVCLNGRTRKAIVTEDASLKATPTALKILMEGKAWTTWELALEAQRRGCRSADEPSAVAHAIRSGLRYYRRHLKRDDNGRWSVECAGRST